MYDAGASTVQQNWVRILRGDMTVNLVDGIGRLSTAYSAVGRIACKDEPEQQESTTGN